MATRNEIAELYVANFGRAADTAGLDYWSGNDNGGTTPITDLTDIEDIANSFADSPEFAAAYDVTDREGTIEKMYVNIFNREADSAGLQYWVDSGIELDSMIVALLNGALGSDQDYINNRTEVALAFADAGLDNVGQAYSIMHDVNADYATVEAAIAAINAEAGIVTAVTVPLTTGTDMIDGGAGDDSFEAYLGQNAFSGSVANTLSSADKLDGKAGADSLHAQLVPEFFGSTGDNQIDVQVRTTSIETVTFEAREINFGDDNNINDNDTSLVTVDAKDMTGVTSIGSKFSDGDLSIENLTTLTDAGNINAVSSMTITMNHTDSMNSDEDASDLRVLFDEDYLTPTTSFGESGIVFKMMNQDAYDANGGADRLDGVFVGKMVITLEDVEYDLAPYIQEDGETGLGAEFKTETALVAHLNAVVLPALKADYADDEAVSAAMESLIFTIGAKWNDNNVNRIGDEIVLSVSNEFSLVVGSADLELNQAEGVPNDYASNRIERADNYTGQDSESISINIELEKAGRDGEGGNLVVGAKDLNLNGNTDVDDTDGIPTFNITVKGDEDRPSNLGRITSTNQELKTVNIVSEERTDSSYAALTVRGDRGDLEAESGSNPFGGTLDTLDASAFKGDLAIGEDTDALNIDTFIATGGGDVTLEETITADGAFTVTTAGGDDSIDTAVSMSASALHTFSLDVNTASGDDTSVVTFDNQTDTNFLNTLQLSNVNVNTGSGDDKLTLGQNDGNYSTADIDMGSGNDLVTISNDAGKESWVFNVDQLGGSYVGRGDDAYKVFGLKLQVEFEGITSSIVTIAYDTTNYTTSAQAINDAIKAAIADDAQLVNLLKTSDLRDNGLTISSLVDRALASDALNVNFIAPKYEGDTTSPDTLSQDDNARYNADTYEVFNSRISIDSADLDDAWAAWYPGSIGIAGASGTGIYAAANTAAAVFEAMFNAADSDDVNANGTLDSGETDAAANADDNLNDGTSFTYNQINLGGGTNNNEISITDITLGTGDDMAILNTNKAFGAGFATIELVANFGHDTIMNFNTGTVTGTADVIDYSAFLDPIAAARASSASSVVANDMRVEQDVPYTFQNLVGAAANTAAVDHNAVITVELSDLWSNLTATAATKPTSFADVTATMIQTALNAILADANFTGNTLAESKQDGSLVVFNVVYDEYIESDTNDYGVLGNATDLRLMKVFSAEVAYDSTAAAASNLTLTSVVDQGTIEFGDMYSDIGDIAADSVSGTAEQVAAETNELEVIDRENEAAYSGFDIVIDDTNTTLNGYDSGSNTYVSSSHASLASQSYHGDNPDVLITNNAVVTYAVSNIDAGTDFDITIEDGGSLTGTAAAFTGDDVDITGGISITSAVAATAYDFSTLTVSGTVTVAMAAGTVNVASNFDGATVTMAAGANSVAKAQLDSMATLTTTAVTLTAATTAALTADLAKITATSVTVDFAAAETMTAAAVTAAFGTIADTAVVATAADTISISTLVAATNATEAIDTFVFAAETDVTITGFTSGTDVIDGLDSAADTTTTGEVTIGTYSEVAVATVIDSGFTVVTSANNATSLSEADVATYLADIDGAAAAITTEADDELFYIAVDNGVSTGIYLVTDDGTDTAAISAGELDLVTTLVGVTDASTLVATDFDGFA